MADNAHQNAIARREELKKELELIEQFLETYERFSGSYTKPVVVTKANEKLDLMGDMTVTLHKRRFHKTLKPKEMVKVARTILLEAQRPMTRGGIAKAIEEKGIKIPSTDKARYVGTILWRFQEDFENIEGHGYWLKNTPVPESTH